MATAGPGEGHKEYRVKLADVGSKKINIMRFKPPHTCDLGQLSNPTLERQDAHMDEEEAPEYGEGSEFGRKRREEARKRKRGIRIRKAHPDDQPWVLKEQKRGGKHFLGRKEGGINRSASYYLFIPRQDGTCEAFPVSNWYDFVPPVQYNYLNDEEAEERFEKRNKTLNYFSIMVSKRIKEKEGEEGEMEEKLKSGKKKGSLQLIESDSDEFSSVGSEREEDEDDLSVRKKRKQGRAGGAGKKRKGSQRKRVEHSDSEAGEETDEGDMESREMDYITDTSSDSEEEKAKIAVKDQPRDDAEVERKEEKDIDHVFVESSSDSEDEELTESGKELKALIQKQAHESSAGEGEATEEEEGVESQEKQPSWTAVTTATNRTTTAPEQPTTASTTTTVPTPSSQPSSSSSSTTTTAKPAGVKREAETDATAGSAPPAKKSKDDTPSTITAQEVRKYLQRRPMMPKELVKKFLKLKTAMDKQQVVAELGQLLRKMSDVSKQEVRGKMHLSLHPATSGTTS